MLKKLINKFKCLIGEHEYTCLAKQGISPDPVKVKENPIGYFTEYSALRCEHCDYKYTGSK